MGSFTELLTRRRFVGLAAVAAGTLALGGCAEEDEGKAPEAPASSTTFDEPGSASGDGEGGSTSTDTRALVDERVKSMTIEQKVAQLFMVAPEALVEDVDQVTQAGEMTHAGITARPVGGIIYFAQNLLDPTQVTAMLTNVKQFYAEDGSVAPFIGVDEEGGTVVRIADNEAFGVTDEGNASDIGNAGDAEAAKQSAERIAAYLEPLGFNLDFAPVADVVDPLRSDTMGVRSFSSDAAVAADMVRAEVEGFRAKDMVCCAKHFPGIGSAAGDSHDDSITIEKTVEELQETEFVPFKAAIEAGVPMIMVGHLNLPNIVSDGVPSSMSSEVVQALLRDELGYTGIVITDSLSMGAIANYYTPTQAAVGALKAGCDIALMPERFGEAYQGVLDAVRTGELSETRIDESVIRILTAKQQYFGL